MIHNKICLIRPGCLRPSIALTVQNRGLKHHSFIVLHKMCLNKKSAWKKVILHVSVDGSSSIQDEWLGWNYMDHFKSSIPDLCDRWYRLITSNTHPSLPHPSNSHSLGSHIVVSCSGTMNGFCVIERFTTVVFRFKLRWIQNE